MLRVRSVSTSKSTQVLLFGAGVVVEIFIALASYFLIRLLPQRDKLLDLRGLEYLTSRQRVKIVWIHSRVVVSSMSSGRGRFAWVASHLARNETAQVWSTLEEEWVEVASSIRAVQYSRETVEIELALEAR